VLRCAAVAERLPAHTILRALRDVRGLTQNAWADRLGYSSASLRRWESGAAVLSAQAEAALIACCREDELFRAYEHGPLSGMLLTPELLKDALAEARLEAAGAAIPADAGAPPPGGLDQSSTGERSNLPAHLPPLIGRDAELALLRERVLGDRAALLTLTGPGGVGKTRLALQLGTDLLGSFSGGVWLVEFAAISDPELLAGAAAAVFGIQEQANRSLRQGLIELLRPRAALLVFDNCEHLVAACAALAVELLAACASLRILATSREPLRTPAETIWTVPSLATPGAQAQTIPDELQEVPSVRLFVDRAQAVQPAFVLTPVNGPVIAQICARLDGLPLAIELAAARVRVLSVDQIADRLDDAFHLLVGGSRTSPSRQQTLKAALDWSYALLREPEKVLFRRLAVFAGGFDLEAAESVGAGAGIQTGEVLEVLTNLIDKSLIQRALRSAEVSPPPTPRFRFLEPVRQYAQAQLIAPAAERQGEADATCQRHAEHYLALAEQAAPHLFGSNQREWFRRLELDHDNLRSALRWSQPLDAGSVEANSTRAQHYLRLALALGRFWLACCHFGEGSRWLEGTLGIPAPPELQARRLVLAGLLARYSGDLSLALAHLDEGRILSERAGDAATAAWACAPMGAIYLDAGDLDRADELLQAGVRFSRVAGEPRLIGVALSNLGESSRVQGRYAQAVSLYEEAELQARLAGDPHLEAGMLGAHGQTAALQGDYRRAVELLVQSLDLADDLGEVRRGALNVEGIAAVLGLTGRPIEAAHLFAATQTWRDQTGTRRERPDQILHTLGLAAAQEAMAPPAFAAAWAAGQGVPLAQASAYARLLTHADQTRRPARPTTGTPAHAAYALTRREREIADLLAAELSNREIADRLGIGEGTARIHVGRVLSKLGLRSRWQVAAWARGIQPVSET
jgi:predicted ATPase/DNA-binding NarL/FixJ family response regulator/transcriptional regulator with XRE-family HTH domain